jgi:hypothetical protein
MTLYLNYPLSRVKPRGYAKSPCERLPGSIPIGYAHVHPMEGVRLSPSTPAATAQGSWARQCPRPPSEGSSSLTPTKHRPEPRATYWASEAEQEQRFHSASPINKHEALSATSSIGSSYWCDITGQSPSQTLGAAGSKAHSLVPRPWKPREGSPGVGQTTTDSPR